MEVVRTPAILSPQFHFGRALGNFPASGLHENETVLSLGD
jgi:hypothetical protein